MSDASPEGLNPPDAVNLDGITLDGITWPRDWLDDEMFRIYLTERVDETASALPHIDDLYFACALSRGVPGALAAFERTVLQKLKRSLLQTYQSGSFVDDVCQALRERLFVQCLKADSERPRIADYRGRAPLQSWVRVIANRLAVDLHRRERARHEYPLETGEKSPLSSLSEILVRRCSQELDLIRSELAPELKSAITTALATLSDEAHNLLRLHYVSGLSLTAIGRILQKEPSTILRRLTKARAEVYQSTYRSLAGRLKVSATEFDSILHALGSKLEISRL